MIEIVTDEKLLRQVSKRTTMKRVKDYMMVEKIKEALKHGWCPGYGLAAVQIGMPERMAWYWIPNRADPRASEGRILLNPMILKKEEKIIKPGEGCLSIPRRVFNTSRYNKITYVSDDKEYTVEGLEAQIIQHECLSHRTVVKTRVGNMSIKELYSRKDIKYVLGCDGSSPRFFKIVKVSRRKNTNKKWVSISFDAPKRGLVCTEDHLCAVLDDIIRPMTYDYIPARDLLDKFVIRNVNCRTRNHEHSLFNWAQMSFILGTLLGDACISKRGELIITHGKKQRKYVDYIAKMLHGKIREAKSGFSNDAVYKVVCRVNAQTAFLRELLYSDGRKNIKSIIEYLDPISMAAWYMDDGCLVQGKYAQIHTESFDIEQLAYLVYYLRKSWHIEFKTMKRMVRGVSRFVLFANKSNSRKFFRLIADFMCESMYYKLSKEYIPTQKARVRINNKMLKFSACRVKSVKDKVNFQSALYDIKVKGAHHNFYANNTLVHNCDHMDGILIVDRKYTPSNVGRNDPCPCGSGKKYKKCCMNGPKSGITIQ